MQDIVKGTKVIILAGGVGSRLRGLVKDVPKPMAPVAGKPFLECLIMLLKKQGFVDFIISVGYLGDRIVSHFNDGSDFGVSIVYTKEEKLLGTAGALKLAEEYINSTFIFMNGDTYADMDYTDLISFHKLNRGVATVAMTKVESGDGYAKIVCDSDSRIVRYMEKDASSGEKWVSAGVYVMEPKFLNYIDRNKVASLERETIPRVLADNGILYAYANESVFYDIGTPDSYQRFVNIYSNERRT